MIIIEHRKNTIEQLKSVPPNHGIEVDIRSFGNKLMIHHDPFIEGEDFLGWIKHYNHAMLILNVKEEGLEARLLEVMSQYKIQDFFFLDQSFPFLIKTAKRGERRCAVRLSEFESIDTVLALANKVDWVWVDCFNHYPLTSEDIHTLKDANFKLCLVSPELQGRFDDMGIVQIKKLFDSCNISIDATCTKTPDKWYAQ